MNQGRVSYRFLINHFDYTWKIPSLKTKVLLNLETFLYTYKVDVVKVVCPAFKNSFEITANSVCRVKC